MQQRIGKYEIIETVAAGGQATVYRARDTELGRIVALKVMHPHLSGDTDYVERFVREARTAASLSHPNVAVIYEVGAEGSTNFISMEFVPTTLDALLKERGTLPWAEARELLLQVARALRAAERQGIVHRDLKPQNILLDEDGQAKVADFGIARAAEFGTMTATGMVLGTPQYMSPEQARGERVDTRSDLYALGVVLCQMLAGRTPLQGTTPQQVMRHHLLEQDVPLDALVDAGVPADADSIVRRLLAKDPADRIADPQALIDLVEASEEPAQPVATAASESPPAPTPPAEPATAPTPQPPPAAAVSAPPPVEASAELAGPTGRHFRCLRWAGALGLLLLSIGWLAGSSDELATDGARGLLLIADALALVSIGLLLLGKRGRARATSVLVAGSFVTGIWGIGMIPTAPDDGGLGGASFATPTPTATAGPTPTASPLPVAFAGFDLPLEDGTFWEYDWTYVDRSCAQGSGCSTDEDAGAFVVSLGPDRTVDDAVVFEVNVTGKSAVDLPNVKRDFAPRWRYLGVDADGIVGSDGFTLTRLFNARTGTWAGSGYFTDRLEPNELIVATSDELTDAFEIATWPGVRTGPVVLAGRASSESQCEIIEGLRICPREDTFSFTETEFFRAGVGPLGYRWNSTASFSGGNFFSSSESTEWVGLVGSSLRGDVAPEPTPTATLVPRPIVTPTPTATPDLRRLIGQTPTPIRLRPILDPPTPTPAPGSTSGSLLHIDDGSIEMALAGVDHRDVLAEVVFANPYSSDEGSWSHGIMFRRSDVNNFHAVGVRSDGSWFHVVRTGTVESSRTVAEGSLADVDLSAFGVNHVRVLAQGDRGWLFVNRALAGELDLREWGASGDVGAMTGFFTGDEIPGRSTDYKGFEVSALTFQGGPVSGELAHSDEVIVEEALGDGLTNVLAEVQFTNPYGASVGPWDYGFMVRNPAFNEFHAVVLLSDGRWIHEVRTGTRESSATVAQGKGSFGTAAGDTNGLRLIAIDDTGWLFVNGELVAALDLSVRTGPSSVSAITGMFQDNSIPGRSTSFADFAVWSLD